MERSASGSAGIGRVHRPGGFYGRPHQGARGPSQALYGAAGYSPGRKLREGVRVSLKSRAEYGDRSGILSSALSAIGVGELAVSRPDRACAGLYRSALCDRCAGWVAHGWVLWSGSGVAPVAVAKVSSTI